MGREAEGRTHRIEACSSHDYIEWYVFPSLEYNTVWDDAFDGVPFELDVGQMDGLEIFGITDDASATQSYWRAKLFRET